MDREYGLKQLFEGATKEASWCRTCASRGTCTIKETVSMEQMMVNRPIYKYVEATAKCRRYIKDSSVPPVPRNSFESLFGI